MGQGGEEKRASEGEEAWEMLGGQLDIKGLLWMKR